jgi:mycofactocin precursor
VPILCDDLLPSSEVPMVRPLAPAVDEAVSTENQDQAEEALVEADLLVEDVSIDGMCGVY